MTASFIKGFSSQFNELKAEKLEVSGTLPSWLQGSLIRNGPGRFDLPKSRLRHWLDGYAMLHKFEFSDDKVRYTNHQLETNAWTKASKRGTMVLREFGSQPHANIFGLLRYMFFPQYSDNSAINVAMMDNCYVALNESPYITQFDSQTLKRVGFFKFEDKIESGYTITPHPHYDYKNRTLINLATGMKKVGLTSYYNVFRLDEGTRTRKLIAKINEKRAGYMHSFAMTENYVILVEFPIVLENFVGLVFSHDPVIETFSWLPERGTRFFVINKKDGSIRTLQGDAGFGFHQVNAFERGNEIIIDLVGADKISFLKELSFEGFLQPDGGKVPDGQVRRYTLPATGSDVTWETIVPNTVELPRINYRHYSTQDYRWAYTQGARPERDHDFYNQLLKIDMVERKVAGEWHEDGHYPMEPVFVAAPNGKAEDEGVILSVVFDSHSSKSYLLVLNAQTFECCAKVLVPQIIPFGFHGMFFWDNEKRTTLVE